jgi:hypothetical protein
METTMKNHLEWLKGRMVVTPQMEEELLEQEKRQIIDAYSQGLNDWITTDMSIKTINKVSEQYYNETFK